MQGLSTPVRLTALNWGHKVMTLHCLMFGWKLEKDDLIDGGCVTDLVQSSYYGSVQQNLLLFLKVVSQLTGLFLAPLSAGLRDILFLSLILQNIEGRSLICNSKLEFWVAHNYLLVTNKEVSNGARIYVAISRDALLLLGNSPDNFPRIIFCGWNTFLVEPSV